MFRVITGLLLAGHGMQKVSYHLGGEGLEGGVREFRDDGFRGGVLTALAAGGGRRPGWVSGSCSAATVRRLPPPSRPAEPGDPTEPGGACRPTPRCQSPESVSLSLRPICLRDVIPSLRNTLLKWNSMVEVVTNNWVAISGLVSPDAASIAT